MYPKWHVLFGAIFSLALFLIFPFIGFNVILVFLASVLIDVDHYWHYLIRKKDISLKNAFNWHKNLPKFHKPVMHIFHTLEFFIVLCFFSLFFDFLIYILLGIIFHYLLDIIQLGYEKRIHVREYSLIKYLFSDKSKYL